MLRNLTYYNSEPTVRRMIEAVPELTMNLQTLATLLDMTGRVPNLGISMKRALVAAHGNPEPLDDIKAYDLGYLKVDIFADSSMISHPAASTPGASVVNGKLIKPKGFVHSVEGLHKLTKDFISMHCMLDIAAQGAATAKEFTKLVDELWIRSPVEMGADKFLTSLCALMDMQRCGDLEQRQERKAQSQAGHAGDARSSSKTPKKPRTLSHWDRHRPR